MEGRSVRLALQHHAQRRVAHVPTVSVLVGDRRSGHAAWRSHVEPRELVVCTADSATLVADVYLTNPGVREGLRRALTRRAAGLLGVTPHEVGARLDAHTRFDREAFVETLWKALMERGHAPPRGLVDLALLDKSPGEGSAAPALDLLATAATVGAAPPAILIDGHERSIAVVCEAAARVAEAAPSIDVALLVAKAEWARWVLGVATRAMAILREGVVVLEDCAIAPASPPSHSPLSIRSTADDEARSAAERVLFDALERGHDTRGLFTLNQCLPVSFGGAPVEIDMFCRELLVAVEVDGFHHFRGPEAYRRDRRKDVLLQEQGVIVVRVLATDVADHLDDVVSSIRRVVDRRKRSGGTVTP